MKISTWAWIVTTITASSTVSSAAAMLPLKCENLLNGAFEYQKTEGQASPELWLNLSEAVDVQDGLATFIVTLPKGHSKIEGLRIGNSPGDSHYILQFKPDRSLILIRDGQTLTGHYERHPSNDPTGLYGPTLTLDIPVTALADRVGQPGPLPFGDRSSLKYVYRPSLQSLNSEEVLYQVPDSEITHGGNPNQIIFSQEVNRSGVGGLIIGGVEFFNTRITSSEGVEYAYEDEPKKLKNTLSIELESRDGQKKLKGTLSRIGNPVRLVIYVLRY